MSALDPPHECADATNSNAARALTLAAAGFGVVPKLVTVDTTHHETSHGFHDGCWASAFQQHFRLGCVRSSDRESGMAIRQPMSKKLRFEVFKRDKFTCQYCGEAAPKVVLHVDHIRPVAGGGDNDLLNLITACQSCNGGKGARRLDDASEVEKQQPQLAELKAQREQIEMMLQWREALLAERETDFDLIAKEIAKHGGWEVNENGAQDIRRWLKRFPVQLLLDAVTEAFDTYLVWNGDEPTDRSWNKAFNKIPGVASVLKAKQAKPYLRDLFYIQGIVRKRCQNKWINCIDELEAAHLAGATIESLSAYAKGTRELQAFYDGIDEFLAKNGGGK